MLEHTRKHHTSSKHIRSDLSHLEKKDFIPWRESSKERIERNTEAGIMLRGSRYKNQMTQKQLAESLGISQHHISEMEHGKRPIGKEMARRLAAILNIDYRVFL